MGLYASCYIPPCFYDVEDKVWDGVGACVEAPKTPSAKLSLAIWREWGGRVVL